MNPSISLLSLISSILHCLLVLNFCGGVYVKGDIVSDICKGQSMADPRINYDFCVSSLEANPLSKTSDISGLAVISMDLCLKNATYIDTYIDSILKDGKAEPRILRNLKDCMEYYSTASENVQKAMKAFNGKYYYEAINYINNAGIWADTCKLGFTEFGDDFSLLKKQDNDFFQLTSISLNIIAIIRGPKILQ
ncbi:hypothetical protein MKW98_006248 [Papaver atlanticum]|uniref:Pectinesterase inhibitor domain-containing protein n=1 Tax=Papaver atlanticum TaxID=357466 RepID=A0AAD4TDY1_9MAGN|nr:hypothetical protein MKW98_006248 [Papaver atlanticum]